MFSQEVLGKLIVVIKQRLLPSTLCHRENSITMCFQQLSNPKPHFSDGDYSHRHRTHGGTYVCISKLSCCVLLYIITAEDSPERDVSETRISICGVLCTEEQCPLVIQIVTHICQRAYQARFLFVVLISRPCPAERAYIYILHVQSM